jgi:microcystin-dependent protein
MAFTKKILIKLMVLMFNTGTAPRLNTQPTIVLNYIIKV